MAAGKIDRLNSNPPESPDRRAPPTNPSSTRDAWIPNSFAGMAAKSLHRPVGARPSDLNR